MRGALSTLKYLLVAAALAYPLMPFRDGYALHVLVLIMQTGVNRPALEHLLDRTDLPVIVAGGVATLDDVKALSPYAAKGLEGVITGRAIYAGTLDFGAAMAYIAKKSEEAA